MSQKSSVPQAVSFVSQALKRDRPHPKSSCAWAVPPARGIRKDYSGYVTGVIPWPPSSERAKLAVARGHQGVPNV